jgi:hypothetical protein
MGEGKVGARSSVSRAKMTKLKEMCWWQVSFDDGKRFNGGLSPIIFIINMIQAQFARKEDPLAGEVMR